MDTPAVRADVLAAVERLAAAQRSDDKRSDVLGVAVQAAAGRLADAAMPVITEDYLAINRGGVFA